MKIQTTDNLRANLLSVYRQATAAEAQQGSQWYAEAHAIMREWSETYGVSLQTAACVTAALSPQCEWTRNLIIADDILAGRNPSVGGALHLNIKKAQSLRDTLGSNILDSNDISLAMLTAFPSGPKVNAFARNLAGDTEAVTVDAHAAQAAFGSPLAITAVRPTLYRIIAEAYTSLAHELNISPCVLQATVWVVWKRLYPRTEKQRLKKKSNK